MESYHGNTRDLTFKNGKVQSSPLFLDAANGVGYLGMKDLLPFLESTGFKANLFNTEIDIAERLNHQVFFTY